MRSLKRFLLKLLLGKYEYVSYDPYKEWFANQPKKKKQ